MLVMFLSQGWNFSFLPRKGAVRMLPSPIKLLREKCKQVQL